MLPIRFADCTWEQIAALEHERALLILPVGSTEPHGPHLPLATDVLISEGMATRAAERLRARGDVALVLPSILYAITDFAAGFAGAISIRFETACDLMADVLCGAVENGFRRLCVANSHLEPRHVDSITAAIERVRERTGVVVAFPDTRRRRWASRLTEEFRSGACHAGRYESSLVMAERPDLVRDDLRERLTPVPASLSDAIRDGKASFREAGGERAYFGWPADASRHEGEATFATLAEILVEAIDETYGASNAVHHDD